MDPKTINALLDNDQAKLTRMLEEKTRNLQIRLGNLCPECNSTNCAIGDDEGQCSDCEAYFDLNDFPV